MFEWKNKNIINALFQQGQLEKESHKSLYEQSKFNTSLWFTRISIEGSLFSKTELVKAKAECKREKSVEMAREVFLPVTLIWEA